MAPGPKGTLVHPGRPKPPLWQHERGLRVGWRNFSRRIRNHGFPQPMAAAEPSSPARHEFGVQRVSQSEKMSSHHAEKRSCRVTRSSHTRLRAFAGPAIGFEMILLSHDPQAVVLAEEAAPDAVRVFTTAIPDAVEVELQVHDVVCAVVVDMDLDRVTRLTLLERIKSRWGRLPVLAMLRSSSQGALGAAHEIAHEHLFRQAAPVAQVEQMRRFLRDALDARLEMAASMLQHARESDYEGVVLDTFVALSILQVRREELGAFFEITDSGTEWRVRALKEASGFDRFPHLIQQLSLVPRGASSRDLMNSIEERAALLFHGKDRPDTKPEEG